MRRLDWRYALITAAYLAMIFMLSSIPEFAVRESHPVIQLLSNLVHAPIFAGLAYGVLKTFSGGESPGRDQYVFAFGITCALAGLDEWHQSFVPGRMPSAADLLLDLSGISSVLLAVRFRTCALKDSCEAE